MFKVLICLSVLLIIPLGAQLQVDKYPTSFQNASFAVPYDSVIINIGNLENFVANNTMNFSSADDPHSFRIGRDDLRHPSMSWREGGYPDNHYLYSGIFLIGHDSSTVMFNNRTSTDFMVEYNTHNIPSELMVSYSMSDDSAGIRKKGIKTICRVHAWSDYWRDDFFIYEYLIINEGTESLEDIYAGLLMDFDVSVAGSSRRRMAYWADDRVGYLLSMDLNQIPESISFMYDGNDLTNPENDIGGYYNPKESLGYVGSRILNSPGTKKDVPANQMSGHQWFTSRDRPTTGPEYFKKISEENFSFDPHSIDDYQYLQSVGPWDLSPGDTLNLAFALGIGEGISRLIENLQVAYDLYWQVIGEKNRPQIKATTPQEKIVVVNTGDNPTFSISVTDINGDSLVYLWRIDEQLSENHESVYSYASRNFAEGVHSLTVEVSDKKASVIYEWVIIQEGPRVYNLGQNYPNPFNIGTTIPFELKESSNVTITIYNLTGEKIATLIREYLNKGQWVAHWDGEDLNGKPVASGIYYYHLSSGQFSDVKRMLLLK